MSPSSGAIDPPRRGAEAFLRHGGRLSTARQAFAGAPEPWIDLSTGINPRPWPLRRVPASALARLPDPAELAALEAAAARAFGVEPDRVAATPGAEAALRLIPRLTGAQTVEIISPTYGGHAEAWTAAGVAPRSIGRLAEASADAVVVVNPNNPDGAEASPATLTALAAERWAVVDESFIEASPHLSVSAHAGGRLIVLRSFGKFYGLAGLRLGFVVAASEIAARARAAFGDWPVSAEAIAAGIDAYADEDWRAQTLARLGRDAARLDRLLVRAGFEVAGGTALFRLADAGDAWSRFEALARLGVLTRPFAYEPRWLRFGLPGPGQWRRLQHALESLR
jgi:cobalamin biosynthetic protein CobC